MQAAELGIRGLVGSLFQGLQDTQFQELGDNLRERGLVGTHLELGHRHSLDKLEEQFHKQEQLAGTLHKRVELGVALQVDSLLWSKQDRHILEEEHRRQVQQQLIIKESITRSLHVDDGGGGGSRSSGTWDLISLIGEELKLHFDITRLLPLISYLDPLVCFLRFQDTAEMVIGSADHIVLRACVLIPHLDDDLFFVLLIESEGL